MLTPDAIQQFNCDSQAAYALSYSKERSQEFLEDVQVCVCMCIWEQGIDASWA